MANEATILRIRAQVENLEGLNRARSAVRNFATESKAASNDLDKLRSLFKELGSESVRSVNNLKNYRTGLDALRQSAQIGSTTFNELTAEIKQLDIELGTLQGKQAQVASGFNKIASSANAAATATRRQFDLSGAGATFGRTTVAGQARTIRDTTQYAQPIGPRAVDYAAINTGLTQAVQAEQQLTELSRRARQERLLTAEKYNNLEIAAADKKAREELRIQQQGSDRAVADFDRRLANRGKRRANLQQLGQTAGAVAASGVFGGPEGLIGASIGAFAGPGGALAGGAIGATVGSIRQAIGETGKYTAELQLLRIALSGVSTSSKDYENNLEAVNRLSQRFLIPLKDTTEQYTKLQASVQGAGLNSKQTETAFKGIAAAIIATGGSTQDLNSALLATSQVFSKGKVSAEELRGQIGERLAGAFTIFAASIGKTPQQLDKALKDGEVTLANFLTFTEELFKRYGKTADIIAEAPQNAGKRLTLALDNITVQIGRFAGPIGAAFQSIATNIVNGLAPAFEAFANLLDLPKVAAKERLPQIDRQIKAAQKQIDTYRLGEGMPGGRLAFTIPRQLQETQLKALQGERKLIQVTLASVASGVNRTAPRIGDTVGGGASKTAENAAKRLAERTKEQLIASRQLIDTEKARRGVSESNTAMEEIKAKNKEIEAETQKRYNDLLRKSLSDEERTNILIAKRIAVRRNEADAIKKIATERSKALAEENRQRYAEAGLLDVLTEKRQGALAGAFTGGTALGTFRTDINLMPEITGGELGQKIEELRKSLEELNNPIGQIIIGAERIGTAFSESFTGLINGSMSAQESLANFFRSVANHFLDMAMRMISKYVEMQVLGLAQQFFPNMFGSQFGFKGNSFLGSAAFGAGFQAPAFSLNANGNVFAQNGIVPFANGGIVDRPMMFPFAKGIGLMGEAGPEAIMPLKRGADGKLGVAGGGGGTTVNVSVDASGSSVQGDKGQSAALGRAIAASVQAELVKQKRPGGLLA
jgi:tape measure domain-containing protein